MTTKLLVSVRDVEEAVIAVAGPVDILDVKEPRHGSLGAVSPTRAGEIVRAVGGKIPLSVAMGELRDVGSGGPLEEEVLRKFSYAKIGLAGCARRPDWTRQWQAWREGLPRNIQPVAVAYADSQLASAPDPLDVVRSAAALGMCGLLVDTHCKQRGHLFDWCPSEELECLLCSARSAGLWVALAGSISTELLPRVKVMMPDVIAVRGAACPRGRAGRISLQRIEAIAEAIRQDAAVGDSAHSLNPLGDWVRISTRRRTTEVSA